MPVRLPNEAEITKSTKRIPNKVHKISVRNLWKYHTNIEQATDRQQYMNEQYRDALNVQKRKKFEVLFTQQGQAFLSKEKL